METPTATQTTYLYRSEIADKMHPETTGDREYMGINETPL